MQITLLSTFITPMLVLWQLVATPVQPETPGSALPDDISTKANEALSYCKTNKLNTNICFLVDMSLHSGKYRLFLWDFKTGKVLLQGLCSHGCCEHPWGEDNTKTDPTFSNQHESHCSSLGKYQIGQRGWSNWGIHVNYKLHGLEKSNNQAFARQIVLHSWVDVEDEETFPNGTPEGWGCPAVSNAVMKKIDTRLKKEQNPVLFWIYNE